MRQPMTSDMWKPLCWATLVAILCTWTDMSSWFPLEDSVAGPMSSAAVGLAANRSPDRTRFSPARPVTQQKHLGDVRLTLHVDRQTLSISDRLHLTLSVATPPDIVVAFPNVTDKLGPFTVLSQTPMGPLTTTSHSQEWQRDYTLEAEKLGELILPALTVSLQNAETAQGASPQQLSTDPLTITVTSVVPPDADVTAPRDIAPPIVMTPRGVPLWVWIAAVVMAGLVLFGSVWWYRRRRKPIVAPTPPQPAHLLALEALQRLQHQDLITQQHIEPFYVRLSNILRHYVEWRFGLRAPEQTTEEFLASILVTGGLIATHRDLLGAFLAHCDLVKFARHQPTPDDMHHALESARAFVEQTADDRVLVAVPSSGVEAS